ncbi:glutamine synthetase 2 [Dunaliella salina]|uniref:Glutamine synthetase n=1 Tax=Dunaliella salina TaxID=3046 RepID=A0ABQ7GJ06_DUNSA|nr:glutamine synthetase 2 [Dunaliella salina]|eukprot:KAF5834582.1 glutamine synthetase 2 [Dunaliella salina]
MATMMQKSAAQAPVARSSFGVAPRVGRTLSVRANAAKKLVQKAEYIWSDGQEGMDTRGLLFNELHSKTKTLDTELSLDPSEYPDWSFDGSSTGQAEGNNSDCILRPVRVVPDPIRGAPHVLVMCEVFSPDGSAHPSNTRAKLREQLTPKALEQDCWFGFEQEYTMLNASGKPYGWPVNGYPAPQGPYYCGVGSESVHGRPLVEAHLEACMAAGINISGVNAEVMPGQWEFQVGPSGPLDVGDEVHLARWLLHRLGEDYGIVVTFEPKPMPGDWNGAGAHTNFSTEDMRVPGGMDAINKAIENLSKTHVEHISQYGLNNDQRLTGKHETCDMNIFKFGVADRGSSIRIPLPVQLKGYGYLEDRRPSANCDPYNVARLLIKSVINM